MLTLGVWNIKTVCVCNLSVCVSNALDLASHALWIWEAKKLVMIESKLIVSWCLTVRLV